jgi:hypothetical protein
MDIFKIIISRPGENGEKIEKEDTNITLKDPGKRDQLEKSIRKAYKKLYGEEVKICFYYRS